MSVTMPSLLDLALQVHVGLLGPICPWWGRTSCCWNVMGNFLCMSGTQISIIRIVSKSHSLQRKIYQFSFNAFCWVCLWFESSATDHFSVIKVWFFFLQPCRNTDNKYICPRGGTEQVPLYWCRQFLNINGTYTSTVFIVNKAHNLQHLFWAWTLVRMWHFPKMGHVFCGLSRLIPYLVLLNQVSDFQTI